MFLDLSEKMRGALNRKETITISARCSVRYSGRAESFLEEGDRIIIIKQDGSMFVHQPEGLNPVNYMKEGSDHSIVLGGDFLKIDSANIPKKEFMYTLITRVHAFFSQKMEYAEKIILAGNEK